MERKEEMQTEHDDGCSGSRLAEEAVEHMMQGASDYCDYARQRIELANQPEILALRFQGALLEDHERNLVERVRRAAPQENLCNRRRESVYHWAVALFLSTAGLCFALFTFDPYRIGWKGYLYCAGIAVIAPYSIERFLRAYSSPRLIRALTGVACMAALASLATLAIIRGELFIQHVQDANPVVVFGNQDAAPGPLRDFYESTLPQLKVVMLLLAIAMELGAGLALHHARELCVGSGEDHTRLARELATVRQQKIACAYEICVRQNEAAVFVTQFWRDFHRAMLNGAARRALKRLSVLLLGLLLLGPVLAHAGERLHLVVAPDLSKSEEAKDHDNRAEFEKNLDGVSRLLANLPAGARVTIIGVTGNSFAQPYILLDAKLDEDEGYFKERLTAARRQVVGAWKQRCAKLHPEFSHTDIFGALLVAAELFKQTPLARHVLVTFSDMRQETSLIDLESPTVISVDRSLTKVVKHNLLADLRGVEVYALGVDSSGKTIDYWNSLRDFWVAYFSKARVDLRTYSILRDPPDIGRSR